ncbi:hypothetical protein V2J91_23595 [Pseudomonas alliivorans]|nr:hypothetical protein [Pseudomonas alliivorans]
MRGKYWKRICEIPAYMFLLSPSGKRVQKMEGGNWIDQHEAQKVVDSAEDELSDLRAELADLKTGYEAYERVNAELRAECERLRKDADRIDFIDKNWFYNPYGQGVQFMFNEMWEGEGHELRTAIDNAMSKEASHD